MTPIEEDNNVEHVVMGVMGKSQQLFILEKVITLESLEDDLLLGVVDFIERALRNGEGSCYVVHLHCLDAATYKVLHRGVEYAVSKRDFIVCKSLYFLHKLEFWVQSYKKMEKRAAFSAVFITFADRKMTENNIIHN